ncbi:Hypothetical Protein FCC1311_034352 [Hondaea fermentalgiana]|uniref:Uncharacterized protein n=1 Tax=Hondaea fermentalgiana TaxID=2315210 RepID=A0A2R5G833_9STRA|nr:Hypothetical Protein FCC1311_034352 [Hondaea fermentalgiana]|eukprot:GBG27212.1 Hypothetical Protein FCC1311_034352 [Hondaea fermentalgiana]
MVKATLAFVFKKTAAMSEAWLETEATRCWIRASQALAQRARVQGRVVKAEIHDSTPGSNPLAGISRAEEEGKVGDTENLKRNSKDQISRSLRVLRVHASGLVVTDGRHKARAALESKGGPRELVTAECQPGTMLEVLECCLAFDDIALGRPLANRKHGSIIPLEIKPASNDSECWDAGHWGSAAPFLGTQSPRASQTSNNQQAQVKEGESEVASQHEHSEEVQNFEDNSRELVWTGSAVLEDIACKPWAPNPVASQAAEHVVTGKDLKGQ